ncbi:unnamed protein product [Taenia asiatica]|uniref:Protein YIPF3 n=1 Tax=Taenia asiatica TaxID=60517 RepID=A0A0R3VZ09_TAEAS|nr:unnamed protein product [Taenia asiatica]
MLPMHGDESPPTTVQRSNSRSNMGPSELFSAFSASVWSESKKRAESAYQNYARIDSFRPYFDVEPKEVLGRVFKSIDPRPPFSLASGHDLYGPFIACLTLIAVLLFEMKLSDHKVQEGTLMGSAFLTCFGYWLASSGILLAASYFGKRRMCFCAAKKYHSLLTTRIVSNNSVPLVIFGCRIAGAVAAFALHMLFVLYLHFAYHTIVQGKIWHNLF